MLGINNFLDAIPLAPESDLMLLFSVRFMLPPYVSLKLLNSLGLNCYGVTGTLAVSDKEAFLNCMVYFYL